ncbi:MAG: hypothetical protein M5U22_00100 [Thermoleophilia bacterium]|nr:hypothetical protein [Thermoleophilia bacterium]
MRVGLRYLKQMSERALKAIEAERRYAPFASFEDFYLRTRVEYPVAENLIRAGAFDSLEPDRTELLWRLPCCTTGGKLWPVRGPGGGDSCGPSSPRRSGPVSSAPGLSRTRSAPSSSSWGSP